jgi:hypothetical protein
LIAGARLRSTAAAPRETIFLKLALPGGTDFLGRLDADGCKPQTDVPAGALLLASDGHDARLARNSPIRRREAVALVSEINPDVEYRIIFRPGARNVVYGRPCDELPDDGSLCPLALALELLDVREAGASGVTVLSIGDDSRPDLLFIVGRDPDGEIDPGSLQVWLRPQDDVATLTREFARRGQYRVTADQRVLTQRDLLEAAPRLPRYPRSYELLGRSLDQWAGAGVVVFGFAAIVASAAAAAEWLALEQARRSLATIEALAARQDGRMEQILQADPVRLASAASVDYRRLIDGARLLWLPGASVRLAANAKDRRLTVSLRLTRQEGAGADTQPSTGMDRFAPAIERALSVPPPAGFERRQVYLNGDIDGLAISYRAKDGPGPAAHLLGD